MNRIARIAVIAGASLALLLAVLAGVALVVINPNAYKPKIEAAALKATGKTLQLQGDLSLSLFPKIHIESGPAFMADDPSFGPDPFLRVDNISASIALGPLFRGRAEIGDVEISGARVKLAVNQKGANNWTMPDESPDQSGKSPEPASAPPKKSSLSSIALDALTVTDATVVYANIPAKTDMVFSITKLALENVRVGQKSTLNLDAAIKGILPNPAPLTLAASFTLPPTPAEGSPVAAKGAFAGIPFSFEGFAALSEGMALKGDASFGDINLDTLTAPPARKKATGGGGSPDGKTVAASANDNPAETLRSLFLDLHITARSVTAGNIPVRNIEATVKADRGLITAKPISCNVFGPINAEASLDARGPAIKSRMTGKWENADLGPLLKAAGGKKPVTGTLNTAWNVNATGLAWPSAVKTLGGKVDINLSNGFVPGFQLIPAGLPGLPATSLDLADVRCSSTWNITGGIAVNNDLTLKAAALTGAGAGAIDIPAERIDYTLEMTIPTIRELPGLKILPILISGPLSSPAYRIDQAAALKQTVKSVLDPSTPVGKEVQKGLGKALQKLF